MADDAIPLPSDRLRATVISHFRMTTLLFSDDWPAVFAAPLTRFTGTPC